MRYVPEEQALHVTGEPLDTEEARSLMAQIIVAEVNEWVPEASQRLVARAVRALGFPQQGAPLEADHGPDRRDHPLTPTWVGGVYVLQCTTCHRLFGS